MDYEANYARSPASARPSPPTTTSARCWCSSRAPRSTTRSTSARSASATAEPPPRPPVTRADRDHTRATSGPGTQASPCCPSRSDSPASTSPSDFLGKVEQFVDVREPELGRLRAPPARELALPQARRERPPELRAEVGATSYVAPPMVGLDAAQATAPATTPERQRRRPASDAAAPPTTTAATSLEPSDEGSQRHLAPAQEPAPPARGVILVGALAAVPFVLAKEPETVAQPALEPVDESATQAPRRRSCDGRSTDSTGRKVIGEKANPFQSDELPKAKSETTGPKAQTSDTEEPTTPRAAAATTPAGGGTPTTTPAERRRRRRRRRRRPSPVPRPRATTSTT